MFLMINPTLYVAYGFDGLSGQNTSALLPFTRYQACYRLLEDSFHQRYASMSILLYSHSLFSLLTLADAYNQELNSLHFLYLLVVRCCECVSLWKLLCDYQLHLTVTDLGVEDKMQLLASTFRTVVLSGRKVGLLMIFEIAEVGKGWNRYSYYSLSMCG